MPFKQGEVVSFDFRMPDDGNWEKHSAVILSCNDVYKHDKLYLCAMMSSNGVDDLFSFHLTDSDLEQPSSKENSQVRCHLLAYAFEEDLQQSNPYNKLKSQSFERLIAYINSAVFDV